MLAIIALILPPPKITGVRRIHFHPSTDTGSKKSARHPGNFLTIFLKFPLILSYLLSMVF